MHSVSVVIADRANHEFMIYQVTTVCVCVSLFLCNRHWFNRVPCCVETPESVWKLCSPYGRSITAVPNTKLCIFFKIGYAAFMRRTVSGDPAYASIGPNFSQFLCVSYYLLLTLVRGVS
jgi:hypothetical protein